MNYLSVCSGIGTDALAFDGLGWHCLGYSEIEPFPAAVLQHRWPDTPNHGDMLKYEEWKLDARPDLIIGGTPCQPFSIAGAGEGMDDPRGQLTIKYFEMVAHFRPQWFIWENVPGALNTALPRVIDQITESGYSCAWRILDALGFGVPQRRRRLFLVGHHRDWRGPAAVLFDQPSGARIPQPRQASGIDAAGNEGGPDSVYTPQGIAGKIAKGEGRSGTLKANMGGGGNVPMVYAERARIGIIDGRSHAGTLRQGATGTARPMVFRPSGSNNGAILEHDHSGALDHKGGAGGAARMMMRVAFNKPESKEYAQTMGTNEGGNNTSSQFLADNTRLRYLTPEECERLQGIEPGHTAIPWRGKPADQCPRGLRYKAIGNAMCVPVVRWIAERIDALDA